MGEAEQLSEIAGNGPAVSLDVAGGQVEIRPLRARQFGSVFAALEPISEEFSSLIDSVEDGIDAGLLVSLLAKGDYIIQALAAATGKPDDFIGDLEADELLQILLAVIEVNADFFTRRLVPVISRRIPNQLTGTA